MTDRLIPADYDFNLLDFKKPFVVGAKYGLKTVVAPLGQKLKFGRTTQNTTPQGDETKLGHITIRSDGSFEYIPDPSLWDNDPERIDRIEYWVEIPGSIRTTGRFTIRQGWSNQVNNLDLDSSKIPEPKAEYLLHGGETDTELIVNWLHKRGHARSGSRLVILSASYSSDEGAFQKFQERGRPRWDTVQSFVVNTKDVANDRDVKAAIKAATAIFIEGGDQGRYWSIWNDTKLQESLQKRVGEVPIGGSSAGMAILGGEIYVTPIAEEAVNSAEAMSNPLAVLPRRHLTSYESAEPFLKISVQGNVDLLKGVYLETHFTARKRLGRMSAILARTKTANRAIMADEGTALSIDNKGIGTVVGRGRVYFAKPTLKPKPEPDSALTTDDITVFALKAGSEFDLQDWTPRQAQVVTAFKVDRGIILANPAAKDEWYKEYAEATIVEDSLSRDLSARQK